MNVPAGCVDEARSILKAFEEAVPGLAMVRLRRVSLERRHGNMDEAEALLRDAITNGKNNSESSFYAVKLARQLVKVQKSIGKAKKVLLEAVEKDEVVLCSLNEHLINFIPVYQYSNTKSVRPLKLLKFFLWP